MAERDRPVYCTQCGSIVYPEDNFCGVCGARVSPAAQDAAPTEEAPEPARERAGGHALPRVLRFPDPVRDTLLGALLALACAGVLLAALYAWLAIRGTFSESSVPGTIGLVLFALMHGGAASVDVPPIPSLFGLGGSLRLGLPVTSFALLPFLVSLLGARFVAHRARTPMLFVLAVAVTYTLVVAVLAALGTASSESGDVTIRFAPDPLSTALRAFLWVGLGTLLGVAASRGPLLSAPVRQVLRGALWAVGISLAVVLVLAVVIALVQQGLEAPAPAQRTPEVLPQPAIGGSSVGGALATIGTVFALLPIALGNLWLLAHGVPVGFQNAPDLGGVPLIGEALADVPLRVALLGHWPWGIGWRLLLLGPIVGLVLGGMVAARGAPPRARWQQGALVAVPYAAIALLAAVLVGATADATLAGAAKLEVTFRASLGWLLLLLPVGAGLGAVGGLLSKGDAFPIARPNRAFLATSIASTVLVLASLPALAALSPAGTKASGEQRLASPSASGREDTAGREGNAEPSVQEERADDGGTDRNSTEGSAKGDSGPKPGYQRVTDLGGALSVEVPIGWETMTSDEASVEVRNPEGFILSQELTSAEIDAAPELDLYNRIQESGTSLIVVKALAQDYTDDQLLDGVRGLYRYSRSCSDGGRRDYERAPYSGRIQTWNDCNLGVSTVHTLVAAAKDRECAALLWINMAGESDREAAQHILDTFKVECGRLPASATTAVASPSVPASPEAAASPSASPEVSAPASASAQVQTAGPAYNFIEVPRGTPPCPLGLDEVRATYGPNVTCGEGGGYVPDTSGE